MKWPSLELFGKELEEKKKKSVIEILHIRASIKAYILGLLTW